MNNRAMKMILRFTFLITFLFNILYLTYIAMKPGLMSPDEVWFFYSSKNIFDNTHEFVFIPNYLGYGSFFWLISYYLNNPIYLRLVSAISLAVLPLLLLHKKASERNFDIILLLIICIWYISPLAWFSTKLFGPENISFALGSFGTFSIINDKKKVKYFGFFLIGMSISLKLSNIVFLVYSVIYLLIDDKFYIVRNIKKYLLYILLMLFGFVIITPFIIIDLSNFLHNLTNIDNYSLDALKFLLFGQNIEWDGVIDGGMNYLLINVISCITILTLVYIKKSKLFYPLFFSLVFTLFLFSKDMFHIWYLQPLLFLIVLTIINLDFSLNSKQLKFLYFALLLNVMTLAPQTFNTIKAKYDQRIQYNNQIEIINTIEKYNQFRNSEEFIFITEFNLANYSYNYMQFLELNESENSTIFITKRFSNVPKIKSIIKNARQQENGYNLLEETSFIYIIEYTNQ